MRHILLALVFLLTAAVSAPAAEKTFSQFAVDLPDGWTSDERPGFQSGHPDEYMLLLGKRGEDVYKRQPVRRLPRPAAGSQKNLPCRRVSSFFCHSGPFDIIS